EFFEYTPVCPEVQCGLSIPREAMRLVGTAENPRLVTIKSGIDYTDQMKKWGEEILTFLADKKLCGFIFKAKSPSSGMERIKIYPEQGGTPQKNGRGIFAAMYMERFPFIPVEDEGRLHDPLLRENFIERVFAYRRWQELTESDFSVHRLMQFHAAHKLLLMAHSNVHYRECGKIAASAVKTNLREVSDRYFNSFMEGMKKPATISKNCNVLQHILGYFKKNLTAEEKAESLELIEHYRKGLIPLIVPVTLMNHYVRKYDEQYLKEQYFLHPHPIELKLRNHA
nr:DUF523 and DUF1722 domain-containing protein [Spirochaetota bacterium]